MIDVIEQGRADEARRVGHGVGERHVLVAGRGVAAGMVVHQHERAGRLAQGDAQQSRALTCRPWMPPDAARRAARRPCRPSSDRTQSSS